MNVLEILLGQVPEAIYFALFMILVKEYKEKRVVFTLLMVLEYLLLLNALPFSTWAHALYFVISFVVMKVLYKNKCNVTDVFTLGIASIVLIITSMLCYIICRNTFLATIMNRVVIFVLLFVFRNKLSNIRKLYYKLWNRNDTVQKKMKTTTFRAINVVVFNVSFYIINISMLVVVFLKSLEVN